MSLALYGRTLRYLRLRQVAARIAFRLARPRLDFRTAPRRAGGSVASWVEGAPHAPGLVGPLRFCFQNEIASLEECGWNGPGPSRLWRYHQHYFDDLHAPDAGSRIEWHRALVARWIRENPPPHGTGWEPYPVSLRIVNWIKWFLRGEAPREEWLQSLAVQVRWLCRRLEWHLLGNHLFANAKALVFAGAFFEGAEAQQWLARGLRILAREIPEQILADGGHFERSVMYHSIALEDMLDLINLAGTFSRRVDAETLDGWRSVAANMLGFLQGFTHPDGEIVLFNDAAFGVAPKPAHLAEYARRLGIQARSGSQEQSAHEISAKLWPETGYLRLGAPSTDLFLDCAQIGPDYLPGHAHADTLTFEWSLSGHRLIVDSGTSTYATSTERLRQRATPAHNTVTVDEVDSSEVWSSFRVARRAYPDALQLRNQGGSIGVSCAHDGYARLPGRPRHRRQWTLRPRQLDVEDEVSGGHRSAIARFHLHPDWRWEAGEGARGRFVHPQGAVVDYEILCGLAHVAPSRYHPGFGVSLASQCLVVELRDARSHVVFRWRDAE